MPLDKKVLKAKLLGRYASHLDEVLDEIDDNHRLHISEIEGIALDLRQDVGGDVTEALTEEESQDNDGDVNCPRCHQPMRAKGRKPKWVKTQTGMVHVSRPYYYCETCRKGHFPL